MSTNITTKSPLTPSTYNKKFARSQWRKSFGGNQSQFTFTRAGGAG
jgi:hypothetical protein